MAHKFIAHRAIDSELVSALRGAQHEVFFVPDMDKDISEEDLCHKANAEDFIILTGDENYAWDLFQQKKVVSGIIHVDVNAENPIAKAKIVLDSVLKKDKELYGNFTTITQGNINQRELKKP